MSNASQVVSTPTLRPRRTRSGWLTGVLLPLVSVTAACSGTPDLSPPATEPAAGSATGGAWGTSGGASGSSAAPESNGGSSGASLAGAAGSGVLGGGASPGNPGEAGGASASTGGDSAAGGAGATDVPLGPVVYQESFDALSPGLWKNNVDGAKIKAHPENAAVTASCGANGSSCFRVVYRQADGIHEQPESSPVFSNTSGVMDWADSDTDSTNTATDVTQANINIVASTTGKEKATATAVPSKAYTLTYSLYFEPGFDFAKGGKLPGLAAAAFDSGCTEDGDTKRQSSNWSERLMWRANGRLQMYSYDQSRASGSCGVEKTIDEEPGDPQFELPGTIPNDSKFRLKPGVWYTVRLSVRVNDNDSVSYLKDASGNLLKDADGYLQPTGGNGEVSLAVKAADGSGARVEVLTNVALRDECNGPCPKAVPDSKETWVNGLFFSTFYGGNETKRTTCVDSTQSTLSNVVAAKMPSFPGLTQSAFNTLCASQINPAIFPKLTWNPQTPSAAHFDDFVINQGYTKAPLE